MDYAVCSVPAAAVRKKASHKVEMVNQLLFGEALAILKQKGKWFKVQTIHDGYKGWVRGNLITPLSQEPVRCDYIAANILNSIVIAGAEMLVPAGASMPALQNGRGVIGRQDYDFPGIAINRNAVQPGEELVRKLSLGWLNAPYLWGGRTPLGVDCSGFVQVIFKLMGIDLWRDADQQAAQGKNIAHLSGANCGDLAFFKNKKHRISHVGILLTASRIIHASGKVRIDKIDETGIVNGDTGKRIHVLDSIRRHW